ncbi:DUF5996 family protein [Arthrobacter sunyaminii]|uniref:Uncharacterized protein n=1 Tax=Arthrobacter sunyaminii TaxID=2816859 RepID=A0A975XLE8_9MICC|nr:DUF5996 family protein [Arthrobacter sunyaminii]MBO0907900.1 hypothetical protein [Arthrobacter sunyaminii]QWQ36952.1 hypothetical protein KG104_03910 [Arthrobacter sunyaminii]
MDQRFRNYTEWQDTADTLHLFLQMAGKVKLGRSYKRPEWAHVRMDCTIQGIGTGIIPADACNFEIYFNLAQHHVDVQNSLGARVRIPLVDGLSVADFYGQLMEALEVLGTPTPINTVPQEFHDPVPFDQDAKHHSYDREAVELFLANLQFAYRCLAGFLAPMRGKVDMPAYWFGTMDLSGNVFSGQPAPYSGTDVIGRNGFDEKFFEVGFWPGDTKNTAPSFYALPYPFLADIGTYGSLLEPSMAQFLPEESEFVLRLEDAFAARDPQKAVEDFFRSSFGILQRVDRWKDLDWITEPLTYGG